MKKIAFLGDSITAGAGASASENRYSSVLCKKLGVQELNYGIGGTRIAKQTIPSEQPNYDKDFIERAKIIDKDADFVFVFGGTNDYGHGDAEFGCADDKSPYTFYGALNTLINYLLAFFPKEKICFILPLSRKNENDIYGESGKQKKPRPILNEYRKAIERKCQEYSIEVLSFNDVFTEEKVCNGLTVDGLHPTNEGHNILANLLFDYLKQKGF